MKKSDKRIPVKLAGEPGVRYSKEPLTFGVPFAEGAFPAGSQLRAVTADGRALPLQTAVMTTWKKDLKDVKWLLADIQADPATDGETVFLEYPESSSSVLISGLNPEASGSNHLPRLPEHQHGASGCEEPVDVVAQVAAAGRPEGHAVRGVAVLDPYLAHVLDSAARFQEVPPHAV